MNAEASTLNAPEDRSSGPAIEGIRNVAIIAHVDHGKTTLVDKLLQETRAVPQHRELTDRVLDSNDLERERGLTILAKNISIPYRDVKINVIDTPGHADFGGEVERVLQMANGALLLVDAAEGPMPQTRFVLRKAFMRRLQPVVVINKVDRPDARIDEVIDEIGVLFLELAAELGLDEADAFGEGRGILDYPVIFASARDGWAGRSLDEQNEGMTPLLDTILELVPPPTGDATAPLQLQITTIDYSEFLGRIGIGRIRAGELKLGDRVLATGRGGDRISTVKELFLFEQLGRTAVESASTGDICAVTGIENIEIGDTLTDIENPRPLPIIEVDRPTISMIFYVNDSPLAGLDGEYLTSRHLRARLFREIESNIALRVEEGAEASSYEVSGRGTLHLGILIENMRREGYEFSVGKPRVIFREEGGKKLEPIELLVVQVPEEFSGRVIELLGSRRAEMKKFEPQGPRVNLEFEVPARGLIGIGSRLMNLTQGEALVFHSFLNYQPHRGDIPRRTQGVTIAHEGGTAVPYALFQLKDRGPMFIAPGAKVYEGMIVGEHCKDNDIAVNVCKEKKLTNMRASGSDANVILAPPRQMSIEEALEYIEDDELLEVTPKVSRLRKRLLKEKDRKRAQRQG